MGTFTAELTFGPYQSGIMVEGSYSFRTIQYTGGVAPANFLVTNDAEFADANTNATAGQIIELQDSGTFTNLTLTNATGVTVRGQTSQVPVVRSLTINGAQNATVTGIKVQANATPTGNPKLIDLRGNLTGLVIENCYIRGGNPFASYADFDPTATDTARMGTSGSWSATAPYMDLWYGIGTGGSGATAPSGNFTIRNNTLLDLGAGIKFTVGSTAATSLTINGNIIRRCYIDLISVVLGSTSAQVNGIEICGNELADNFGQAVDNGNPHGDFIQVSVLSTYGFTVPGVLVAGNIGWITPNSRSEAQRVFLEAQKAFVAPIVVDNVMLGRQSNKGVYINSGPGEGAGWGYIYRNVFLANPPSNVQNGNEAFTNSVTGIGPVTIGTVTNDVRNSTALGNPFNFQSLNTVEAIQSYSTNDLVSNITTGLGTVATAYQTWFDTDTLAEWNAITSADATIAALTHKSGFSQYRPMVPGETAAQFRSRWATPSSRPWADLPSYVQWADLTGVTISSVQTSEWSFVHAGGPGTSRSISITGGEYRIADDTAGTNATAWGSTAGTIAHGKYLQVRQTASSSGSTVTTLTVTIGTTTADWAVTTASAFVRPVVTLEATTPDLFRISGASTLGSDGAVGTMAIWGFKMSSIPAAQQLILGQSVGAGRVQLAVLNSSGRLRVNLRNAAGTVIGQFDTTANVCDNVAHDIFFSWDVNDTSTTTGIHVFVDGASSKTPGTWPAAPTTVNYSGSISSYQVGAPNNNAFEMAGFYLNTTTRADFTSSAVRAAFILDPAVMGLNGATPLGTTPIHFLVGTAGQSGGWNDAAGINRGSGSKFIKVGSTAAVDVSGSAWV